MREYNGERFLREHDFELGQWVMHTSAGWIGKIYAFDHEGSPIIIGMDRYRDPASIHNEYNIWTSSLEHYTPTDEEVIILLEGVLDV